MMSYFTSVPNFAGQLRFSVEDVVKWKFRACVNRLASEHPGAENADETVEERKG